jgi:hypothetical protein
MPVPDRAASWLGDGRCRQGPSTPTELRSSLGALAKCVVCSVSNTQRLHMARPSEQLLDRREQRWYRRLAGVGHVQLPVQGYDADNLLVVAPSHQRHAPDGSKMQIAQAPIEVQSADV